MTKNHHWHLLASIGCGAVLAMAGYCLLHWSLNTSFIVGWDIAIFIYLMSIVVMVKNDSFHHHLTQAPEGNKTILTLVAIASVTCLLAIIRQTQVSKGYNGLDKVLNIAFTVITIFSAWLMIQVVFALQYAYLYYSAKRQGDLLPLLFPELGADSADSSADDSIRFPDFFYCAVSIGTSGQTADVAFGSKAGRQLGTIHSIVAFVFNLMIISLLINILSSFL